MVFSKFQYTFPSSLKVNLPDAQIDAFTCNSMLRKIEFKFRWKFIKLLFNLHFLPKENFITLSMLNFLSLKLIGKSREINIILFWMYFKQYLLWFQFMRNWIKISKSKMIEFLKNLKGKLGWKESLKKISFLISTFHVILCYFFLILLLLLKFNDFNVWPKSLLSFSIIMYLLLMRKCSLLHFYF